MMPTDLHRASQRIPAIKLSDVKEKDEITYQVKGCSKLEFQELYWDKMDPDDIIKLNVGGDESMTVTRSLLCSYKGSKLEAMFSPTESHALIYTDDRVFLNRNPKIFRLLLDFLRDGHHVTYFKNEHEKELYRAEL